jgi:hypothetical protein
MDGRNMIDDMKNALRSAGEANHKKAGTSRSEFLLMLRGLHERLDACFQEILTLPKTMARHKARTRRSAESE